LKLEVIFQTATQEVFRLLEVDRVVIYQFNPDWSGSVIAETVRSGWEPLRQLQTIDADIQAYMTKGDHCVAESFQQPLVDQDRYLQDTDGGNFVRGVVRQVNDIEAMNFPACYLDFLRKFQCRAYIIVPILQADRLWGLLAAFQNSDVRQWQASEANLITQMAVQLGVAIQQAELFHQTKTQAKQLKQTLADLQSTQSQLVQTEKMSSLGQLVAGVAHEINNPINFIHGNLSHATDYTQSLLDLVNLYQARYPDPDAELHDRIAAIDLDFIAADLPKLMSSMRVGTERIREIVLSLRSFSRLDEAEFKVADIHAGIDSTLMILQHRLKPQGDFPGIEVVKEYGQLPLIQCYPGQLNQVFMNLLANGIDALEDYNNQRSITEVQAAPSKITIRTTLHNDQWVMIQIADNGLGMSEEVRSRLFSPFFTTKPVGKGTGLGLSISYQIITERHTGKLYCKSAPGQGAEFVIELPIQYKK
jgi:signal transduction histidine kinase